MVVAAGYTLQLWYLITILGICISFFKAEVLTWTNSEKCY